MGPKKKDGGKKKAKESDEPGQKAEDLLSTYNAFVKKIGLPSNPEVVSALSNEEVSAGVGGWDGRGVLAKRGAEVSRIVRFVIVRVPECLGVLCDGGLRCSLPRNQMSNAC